MHPIGTKIVTTIGPATRSPEVLARLLERGVDVVRLNFSHGVPDDHRQTVERVREIANRLGRTIAVLQDLQGPKIRVGCFREGSVTLEQGQQFTLTTEESLGDREQASVSYRRLPQDVRPGQVLLLDDGNIRLRTVQVLPHAVRTVVDIGGPLSDHKGINIPGADLTCPSLTEKDVEDLRLGVELGVDWLAVSFVRSRDDIVCVRDHLVRLDSTAKVMAKIEKPRAVARFAEILEASDGIMLARGDLGVEMPPEEVPVLQKRLIAQVRAAGKPVITATQMLESMIHHPNPTRAEASDVANAIYDGTDAIMLSAETATGHYPLESVEMMQRIARVVEGSPEFHERLDAMRPEPLHSTQDAIALAACEIAESLPAEAIVAFTSTGSSAWRIARNRPRVPLLALTPNPRVCNQLALAFGIRPALAPDPKDTDDMVRIAIEKVKETGLAQPDERMVIAAGVPFGVRGTTNMVRVERVR